jgi:hypothetical protein
VRYKIICTSLKKVFPILQLFLYVGHSACDRHFVIGKGKKGLGVEKMFRERGKGLGVGGWGLGANGKWQATR